MNIDARRDYGELKETRTNRKGSLFLILHTCPSRVCCQGNTGREEVLFLRLYLLQSLLSYIEGNDAQARHQLFKVSARVLAARSSLNTSGLIPS